MTGALNFLPLLVAVAVSLPVVLSRYHGGVDRVLRRVGVGLFGTYVGRLGRNREERERRLEAAHAPTTYRVYAARTLLYAAAMAVAGSIYGVYLLWGLFVTQQVVDRAAVEAALPDALGMLGALFALPTLSAGQLFALLATSSATVGVGLGLATYGLRWWWPAHVAANRRRRIEAGLPQVIAFVHALSRSGMSFPRVMRTLGENRAVYGDAADEVEAAVREMDLLGRDLVTAVQTAADRTPSEQFGEFAANLASVLQSGRSLSRFLREQYERYREQAQAQQEQVLELLATLAEVYVTVLVAGPLFLITILVVMGIAVGGTLDLLRVVTYVVLPLANVAFVVYLTTLTESLRATRERPELDDPLGGLANVRRLGDRDREALSDGGRERAHPNVERVERYEALRDVRDRLSSPVRTLLRDPTAILYVTLPIAAVYLALRLPATVSLAPPSVSLRALDDVVVRALLFVTGTFAVAHRAHTRRVRRIERLVPDMLDRLASINEAGMTVVDSIERLRRSDMGALDDEIERIWRDIEWGADAESALYRFERRVQTTVVTRVVTLLTNAMSASGDLAAVLRVAAEQAKNDRRLARNRRQEMVTYLLVVYVSFLVFLVIVVALDQVFLPAIPKQPPTSPEAPTSGVLGNLGKIDPRAYTLVFFHTALVQGLFSGFVAGQMGGGDPRHGASHAAILLFAAYVAFLLLP